MKLTYEGLKDRTVWAAAGIDLPDYDPEAVSLRTREHPVWVHLGIGNIFRFFLGGIKSFAKRLRLRHRLGLPVIHHVLIWIQIRQILIRHDDRKRYGRHAGILRTPNLFKHADAVIPTAHLQWKKLVFSALIQVVCICLFAGSNTKLQLFLSCFMFYVDVALICMTDVHSRAILFLQVIRHLRQKQAARQCDSCDQEHHQRHSTQRLACAAPSLSISPDHCRDYLPSAESAYHSTYTYARLLYHINALFSTISCVFYSTNLHFY